MKNADSHIVLYAKLHYKISDNFMNDLKKLHAHRCGLEIKHVSDWDVFEVVAHIAIPFIRDRGHWIRIIKDAFLERKWKNIKRNDTMRLRDLIYRLVFGVLQSIQVKTSDGQILYDLDEPDYSILPISDRYKEGSKV